MPSMKPFFDFRDRWQRSPLHWAVLQGHLEAVTIFIKEGATVTLPPHSLKILHKKTTLIGKSPIQTAKELAFDNPYDTNRQEIYNLILRNSNQVQLI